MSQLNAGATDRRQRIDHLRGMLADPQPITPMEEILRMLRHEALDPAAQFESTGTLWEFYHPRGGDPESLYRKSRGRHIPCRDYVGHNPLFAMVDLWRKAAPAEGAR